jgi:AraC family transcriptional regulator
LISYVPNVIRAVDYMERHLKDPISVSDVASVAAYSPFHFVRLFKALTGDTPGNYLRRRRLTEAAKELASGKARIIEIAFEYRFQSQEAFTRAFKESFGINPYAYRQRGGCHLQGAARRINELFLIHCMEVVSMEPKIVKMNALKLIGMMYYGDNKNWEIPKLWEEFMPLIDKIPNNLKVMESYGVCFYSESFQKSGLFYYLAANPVSSLDDIPMAMVGKTLPESEYAVFTHKGSITGPTNTIKDTYAYAYGTWLPNSPYCNPYAYDFEHYDQRFKGNDNPESEMDICIPIRKK